MSYSAETTDEQRMHRNILPSLPDNRSNQCMHMIKSTMAKTWIAAKK